MLEIEEILKKVRKLEIISKKAVVEKLAGAYHSSFKGKGIEFLDVRPYQIGDDFRSIDWNITAKTGELHTRQYYEEREQTIVFFVDVSNSMKFGTRGKLKSETIAEAVALIAFSATFNNDRVGLILFSEDIELFLPPKKRTDYVLRLIRELLYFEPKMKGTNFDLCLSKISKLFPRKINLFVCSDFIGVNNFKGLKVISKKHDLTLITVEDEGENSLPKSGIIKYFDSETSSYGIINTSSKSIQERFKLIRNQEKKNIERQFKSLDLKRIPLSTDKDVLKTLEKYFRERAARR